MFHDKCPVGLTRERRQGEICQARNIGRTIFQGWRLQLQSMKGASNGTLLRRADLVKAIFLWVSVCHIYPVTGCGVDPMRYVENYARTRGFESVNPVLNYMRLNTPTDYTTLMKEKQDFIACTRMVHTGYFKRSQPLPANTQQLLPTRLTDGTQLLIKQNGNRLGQILANGKNYNTETYFEPGLGSQWLNLQQMERLGAQDSLTGLENNAVPSFLQRLKDIGQVPPMLLQTSNNFDNGDFYNGLSQKRR